MMLTTIALLSLAAAAQDPAAAAPAATACPKGLAGLECKAQRLNTLMSDPAVASGVQLFSLLAKKKPKPAAAPAEVAAPAEPPAAENP